MSYSGINVAAINGSNESTTPLTSGFVTGALGTPEARQYSPATSLVVSAFGIPTGLVLNLAAPAITEARFGVPSSPRAFTASASGFTSSGVGRPSAGTFNPALVNRSLSARGAAMTAFGAATTGSPVTATATGALLTLLGAPTLAFGQQATSAGLTISFGAANVRTTGNAMGAKFALLGIPTSARLQPAASTYRATRWGTASSERSDTYLARSIYSPARFAQPTARRLNAFAASGTTSTQFGSPACYLRYRALHTAPTCRFGKPLMLWGTPC